MTNREFVLKAVKRMPAKASFQTFLRELDELLLAESVKRALVRSERGDKGVPAEEVRKLLKGWIRDAKQKTRSHA
jgi:hypothetical protein